MAAMQLGFRRHCGGGGGGAGVGPGGGSGGKGSGLKVVVVVVGQGAKGFASTFVRPQKQRTKFISARAFLGQ